MDKSELKIKGMYGTPLDWALNLKAGDKVRATVLRPYNGHTATIYGKVVGIVITNKIMIRVLYDSCRTIDFYDTDIGKTVFLTLEAAENKLTELQLHE